MTTASFVAITCQTCVPHKHHPGRRTARPRRRDLLALHELLASDTWFDQVTTAGCVNP